MSDDLVLRARQETIRNTLNRNARKRRRSRGKRIDAGIFNKKQIQELQAQCMIIGHNGKVGFYPSRSDPLGQQGYALNVCKYCGAKML